MTEIADAAAGTTAPPALHSARVGTLFSDALRALSAKHEIIGDVRGRGLAVGVDLARDRSTREPVAATTTAKIIYRGYELGAAFTYVGLKANMLEFMPPLTLTEDEAAKGAAIVDQAMTDVSAGKVSDAICRHLYDVVGGHVGGPLSVRRISPPARRRWYLP
jgi:acetylornithine/succinyldiaminopimelate/putrescine aminotransferase